MIRRSILAIALAVCAAMGGAAWAQTTDRVGANNDWSIFQRGDGADRVCWIVTQPVSSTAQRDGKPVSVRRGEIYLMVAIRPGERVQNEVSMASGYPFKSGSSVKAEIGASDFSMFTDDETAWLDSAEVDAQMIAAMRRGANAKLTGVSRRGTTTIDTFSLIGFTAALNEARSLCN